MTRKFAVLGGAALASLLVFSLWDTAEARRGHGGGGGGGYSRGSGGGGHMSRGHSFRGGSHHFRGGGHHFRGGNHFRHAHRFHSHRYLYYGVPFAYGYYSYVDSCHWMRRRALFTGSSYWWNRYNACLYGEGYYYDYD
jgi:hypothetical protein